jgi:predicted ABC-type ATPase
VTYARRIPRWRAAGYHVTLFFLALPVAELGIARVAERVRQGGHHVPDSVVRRRFASGRRNFDRIYRDLVDAWALYDNSGAEPVLMDWREKP